MYSSIPDYLQKKKIERQIRFLRELVVVVVVEGGGGEEGKKRETKMKHFFLVSNHLRIASRISKTFIIPCP
jgi:hypothetical protein